MKRTTIQRKVILETLNLVANHPTAEELYDIISTSYPHISKATVYRNLSLLATEGIISRIDTGNAATRFDHNTKPHYHAQCSICSQLSDIEDLDNGYIMMLQKQIEKQGDFKVDSYSLLFHGICSKCQNNT